MTGVSQSLKQTANVLV